MRRLRDLTLNQKVALAVSGVFVVVVATFLTLLVPMLRQQRERILLRDQRLVEVLHDKHQRDLVSDILTENDDSLAIDVADLARQPGIVWARVVTDTEREIWATAFAEAWTALGVGPPDPARAGEHVLVVSGGLGRFTGRGGQPIGPAAAVAAERLPRIDPSHEGFTEGVLGDEPVLRYAARLQAGDDVFGRLELHYSIADVRRYQALTRRMFFGVIGTMFVALLVLLSAVLARFVVGPIRRVSAAMEEAAAGNLAVRLPLESRDETGTMATAFNRMVTDLASSKEELERHSRTLEERVDQRTRELRRSEDEQRHLRTRLETIIRHVGTGVVAVDGAGRITAFNRRAAQILDLPDEGLEGRLLSDVLTSHSGRALLDVVARVKGGHRLQQAELSLRLPRGRALLSVVVSALPQDEPDGRPLVLVIDDLTQIVASQRLSAWKEAVERVIHEIKNPLTPVALAGEALRDAYQSDRQKFETMFPGGIDMILRSVADLKRLISEFSRFYRLPRLVLRPTDVNDVVREALQPYEGAHMPGIEIVEDLSPSLPTVEADVEQLKRVLLNVVNNGLEAMDGRGGQLRVTTELVDGGRGVVIGIHDQGVGIEDVDRVFEPYYTTKPKGTGLGLLISRQIVEEHGGRVRVKSELGKGTSVEIMLPAPVEPS